MLDSPAPPQLPANTPKPQVSHAALPAWTHRPSALSCRPRESVLLPALAGIRAEGMALHGARNQIPWPSHGRCRGRGEVEVSMELMHKEIADKRLAGKGEPPQTQGLARRCIHGAAH